MSLSPHELAVGRPIFQAGVLGPSVVGILGGKYYGNVTIGSELVESRNSINPGYLRIWSRGLNKRYCRIFDILRAINGEDSYGVSLVLRDSFGGFLPQPPYFSGGQRRGFTFGLSAHRSCGRREFTRMQQSRQALYPRPQRRGFTAQEG